MCLNRGMDTENVAHLQNRTIKNNEFIKLLGKWIELENIILSEATKIQKNADGIHSLISGYSPRSSEYPRYNSQTI